MALNIDMDNNSQDIDLAKNVGVYFSLGKKEMDNILDEVKSVISGWKKIATEIGISRNEQRLMAGAFKV